MTHAFAQQAKERVKAFAAFSLYSSLGPERSLAAFAGTSPLSFKIVLEESDEGGYTVYAPSLPGCISEGETKEESLKNILEAIELYLELY